MQQSWQDQSSTAYYTLPIALNAGERVFVQAEYYQDASGAFAGLEWKVPGQDWQAIPQSSVTSPPLSATGTWRTVSDTATAMAPANGPPRALSHPSPTGVA